MSHPIHFPAADGFRLAGELFEPAGPARARVVIGAAMGVPRSYYRPFAQHLADRGALVLSFDYRGMGGSAQEPPPACRLSDWGERDLAGAFRALQHEAPAARSLFVGHSVGGQLLGFVPELDAEAALFVASQSGYYGNWSGLPRALMFGVWNGLIPLFVSALGRLPMKAARQGEDVPGGVAQQWAEWGRRPGYLWPDAMARGGASFTRWRGRLLSLGIADDRYAPRRSIEALGEMYRAATVLVREVAPRDVGAQEIGHFGFFRRRFEASLWAMALDHLGLAPQTEAQR